MKKLTIFILILTLFISVVSINGNEVHAQKIKWGKITVDDEIDWGKIQIKKNVYSYKLKGNKLVRNEKKVKKGKEYAVKEFDFRKIGNKYLNLYKVGKNLYIAKSKNVKYTYLSKEIRNKLVGNGTLQGTITWQYNKYIGTKPDVGANVIAFPKWNLEFISMNDLTLSAESPSYAKKKGIYTTKVDGFGNYNLTLPAGGYYILIKSAKTTRNPNDQLDDNVLNTIVSCTDGFIDTNNFGLYWYNSISEEIHITKGETYTLSKDWGYTYF